MREISCCFTGHRKIPAFWESDLRTILLFTIDNLYLRGIRRFYTGGAKGFDCLAAEAVLSYRESRHDIALVVVVPHKNQSSGWDEADILRYERINENADEVICLAERYFRGCMQNRNRYMVDRSSVCVCFLTEREGGTAYTVKYAQKRGLEIRNLAERMDAGSHSSTAGPDFLQPDKTSSLQGGAAAL